MVLKRRTFLFRAKRGLTNEPRNIAIFFMRHLKGSKLDEIGWEFDIRKYSSVSTIIERTKQRAIKDRKFKKRIEEIELDLKVSQEQTPLNISWTLSNDLQ